MWPRLSGMVLGCKIIPSGCSGPAFVCYLGEYSCRNTGGLGEGDKGANLAEPPLEDGSCFVCFCFSY